MKIRNRKIIIIIIVLLITCFLSIGFSAFQKQLLIDDSIFNVRLQVDTRVSGKTIQKTSGNAISNSEDYNVKKIYGNVTFPTTSSYVLYKVDLTNYGNVKTGLLNITSNTSGINYSICDSNGNNCTSNPKTSVCNGNSCTLGSTKTIYVKVTSTSTGTKNVDLDLEFAPIHTITYENFNENTTSFKTDIMEGETYELTLTSYPAEVSGVNATVNFNSSNNKFTITNVTNDATITAKYLFTDIAETSYTGTNPNNYVRYGTDLFRIITKEDIDDGYGNNEFRTKITKDTSIGQKMFDATLNDYNRSTLREYLNTTYYNSLSTTQKNLIDTVLWCHSELGDFGDNIGLINSEDYESNSSWLNKSQFTITMGSGGISKKNSFSKYIKISTDFNNQKYDIKKIASTQNLWAIVNGTLIETPSDTIMDTYPTMYLSKDTLMVGGSGTRQDPFLLDKKSDGMQSNPTIIKGRNLTVTGSAQPLVTIENKLGTPYYSTTTILTSSNYTSGSTTIPTASATRSYIIYYYIPAMDGFKAKQGSVTTTISGIKYTINYTKGDNVSEIGKTSDTCTTSGTSLTCNVTLPTITPSSGWENGKWNYNSNQYNPGSSFTLNSSNTGLTMTSSVTGKTYTATIYYYNGSAVATTTRTCTVTTGNSCTFTLPSTVTSSKGVYNSAYKGIASTTNTMESAALSMTQDTTFYAIYSGSVSNRYRAASSYTTRTLYRNEFFKNTTSLDVRLATSNNSATNYTPENGVGGSTWLGLSTANDTTAEYNSVESAAASTSTSLYTIYQFSITYEKGANVSAIGKTGDTCKVTSATSCNVTLPSITPNTGYTSVGWSATNGSTTGVTGTYTISTSGGKLYANAKGSTYTATFYYYDGTQINTTTSNCTVSNTEGNCIVSVPVAVQSSTGPYGSPYKGVSDTASTMEAGSLTISTNGTKFYANYSSGDNASTKVTRYYYSSGYKSNTIYRNEYFISDNAISTVLSTADNGTTNYTSSKGPGSSNWLGLSTAQDTTPEYTTVQAAANSTNRTFYTVYQFVINYQKGSNVSAIGSDSATCNVTTSSTSCSVILPTITPNTGYTSVGWSTENGATSGDAALTTYTLTANNRVLYANAVAANYINTTTNEGYTTLNEAFTAVSNNQTIKVLQDTTETAQAALADTKTGVKLDLNGKTITMSGTHINNNGTMDIYNTSSTTGTINGGANLVIDNKGTLTLNGTSATNKIVIDKTANNNGNGTILNESSKVLTINNNVDIKVSAGTSYGIGNIGTTTISGGTITGTSYGINNSGTATISGGTITGSSNGIINQSGGQLGISGSGTQITTIGSSSAGIYNLGSITMNNGTITGTLEGIWNQGNGRLEINGGTVSGSSSGISNNGITIITGGSINGSPGISNNSGGQLNISGSSTQITGTGSSSPGINNIGTATILGGTVTGTSHGVANQTGGQLEISGSSTQITGTGTSSNGISNYGTTIISGGTVSGAKGITSSNTNSSLSISGNSTQIIGTGTYGLDIKGTTTISGGSITGASNGIVMLSDGTLSINGGTITGTNTGIYSNNGIITISGSGTQITGNSTYGIWQNQSNGNTTITGGTITGTNHGFHLVKGTLTLGTKDSTVSTSSPLIQTMGTSNKYGINVLTDATFNFYDGIIKSSSGTGKAIYGTVSDTPNDYVVRKSTTDGIETAILGQMVHNYQNTTTNAYYETLNDAFSAVANNQTIKVMQNTTETTVATLADTKTGIKLDLNGKTITMDNTYISNTGTLDIYNTSSTTGTITGGANQVLYNNGTFTLNGTSSTNKIVIDKTANNSTNAAIVNSTSKLLTVKSNVEIKESGGLSSGISNQGTATISGGTITGNSNGINNFGTLTITGGSITGNGSVAAGVNNIYTGQLNISGSGTQITGAYYGIANYGTATISDGTITGDSLGIRNLDTTLSGNTYYGTATITGGIIQSSGQYGIRIDSGTTVTLGTKDSDVSISSPLIQTTRTSNGYGVSNGGTFNFYDGIVKSSSGTGYAIYGTVSDTPDTYDVYKETTDGVESAFLAHNGLLMAGIPGDQTTSFLRTDIAKQDIESITFVNSISGHTPNGVNCFDVSKDSDESVLAWTIDSDSDGLYEITIGSYGMVYATDGKELFSQLTNLTTINGMQFFDTSNVTDMSLMFSGCSSLTTLDLTHSNFDTSNVTTMSSMFQDCNNLTTLDLTHSNFDTSNVTTMQYMFLRCSGLISLNLTGSIFDTSNVDNMTGMFNGCSSLTSLDLTHSNFDTSNVTTMLTMFKECSSLTTLDLTYSNFDTSNVNTMAAMFYGCTNLAYLDLTGSNFNTSNVTNMNQMFYGCTNLAYLDLTGPNFNTSNVTSMSNMFYGCTKLVTIHANSFFDTSSVTNSVNMFRNCTSLVGGSGTTYNSSYTNKTYARIDSSVNAGYFTGEGGVLAIGLNAPGTPQDVEKITFQPYLKTPSNYMGSWDASFNSDNSVKGYYSDNDNNGKVELIIESAGYIKFPQDSSKMFYYFAYITSYNGLQFVDTSNVVNMNQLFYYNAGITSLDLSSWDTSNVVDMTEMFWGCNSLTDLNISHFDTSNVTKMIHMFSGCSSLTTLDISSFVTNSLTESWYMFTNCENLRTIYASNGFNIANVTNSTGMFNSCISLIGGQNTTYDDNHIDASYAHIDGGSSNPGYFTDRNATIINGTGTLLNISNDIMSGSRSITNFIDNLNKE